MYLFHLNAVTIYLFLLHFMSPICLLTSHTPSSGSAADETSTSWSINRRESRI